MPPPSISVIIATRNRARRLQRTLDSLVSDDYPHKEIIVCDGASTDGTVELLRSYGDAVRWISEADGGEYPARLRGLAMAKGDVYRFMSDDVVSIPGAFRHAARYLEANPEVDILFGHADMVWTAYEGGPVPQPRIRYDDASVSMRNLIRQSRPLPPSETAFFRRSVVDRIGPFRTELPAADNEMWIRAASRGLRLRVVEETYVGCDLHTIWTFRKALPILLQRGRVAREYGSATDVAFIYVKVVLPGLATLLLRPVLHRLGIRPAASRMRRLREQAARSGRDGPGDATRSGESIESRSRLS